VLLLVAYVAILLSPLVIARLVQPHGDAGLLDELGKSFALVAMVILMMQLVLSARFPAVSRPYGLDMVLRFHRGLAVLAVLMLLMHPILLAAGGDGWSLIFSPATPWYIWLAKIALLLLLLQAVTSLFRQRLRLRFERWRTLHNQALLIVGLGLIHSTVAGSDLQHRPMQILWVVLAVAAVSSYTYHKVRSLGLWTPPSHTVAGLAQETHNVWTLRFEPAPGSRLSSYLPGQFHFLRLYRGDRYHGEEHPFTISSTPSDPARLTSTIKASGDFTRTVGETKPGAPARLQGPFGRFSYLLYPHERDLVFIAGGIGITPLMSMLRHMRDTSADLDVLLLYANRTERDIVFREELNQIARGPRLRPRRPRLRIVHILSAPDADWRGERGYATRDVVARACGENLQGRAFYVCGPPPMMDQVIGALRGLGVPPSRIHSERFALG